MNNYYGRTWADNARPSEILPGTLVNAFLQRVFLIMAAGLAITGLTAWFIFSTTFSDVDGVLQLRDETFLFLFTKPFFYVFVFLPLGINLFINYRFEKMTYSTASIWFAVFALSMGVSLSTIFVAFELGAIYTAFFSAAGAFGAMALYGATTKKDLSKWGSFLIMAAMGIVISSFIHFFTGGETFNLIIGILGVVVFSGLTAYFLQEIMRQSLTMNMDTEEAKKASLFGALLLYITFINLFLSLLRILGGRRD